jgi:hypothetical protein
MTNASNASKEVFAVVGKAAPSLGKSVEVEESSAAAAEGAHSAALKEGEIGHREGMARKEEACRCSGIAEEEIAAGSSLAGRVACSHCTLGQLEGIADLD